MLAVAQILILLRKKPYYLLLITAMLFFLVALFRFNNPVSIHLRDSYYDSHLVTSLLYFVSMPALMLVSLWALYLFTTPLLFSRTLAWAHILLTILTMTLLVVLPFLPEGSSGRLAGMPRRYYEIDDLKSYKLFWRITRITSIVFILFIAGQMIYLTNLAIGLLQKSRSQQNLG